MKPTGGIFGLEGRPLEKCAPLSALQDNFLTLTRHSCHVLKRVMWDQLSRALRGMDPKQSEKKTRYVCYNSEVPSP